MRATHIYCETLVVCVDSARPSRSTSEIARPHACTPCRKQADWRRQVCVENAAQHPPAHLESRVCWTDLDRTMPPLISAATHYFCELLLHRTYACSCCKTCSAAGSVPKCGVHVDHSGLAACPSSQSVTASAAALLHCRWRLSPSCHPGDCSRNIPNASKRIHIWSLSLCRGIRRLVGN